MYLPVESQTRTGRVGDIASPSVMTEPFSAVKESCCKTPCALVPGHSMGALKVGDAGRLRHLERKLPSGGQKACLNVPHSMTRPIGRGSGGEQEGMLEGSTTSLSDDAESSSGTEVTVAEPQASDGINVIHFEPTGFATTPREPENLSPQDKEVLAELLERRGRNTGRPHRIPGTLAQSKVVPMLLDTGAYCSLMPHRLFLELQAFKPSLTLTTTKRTLHGVEGSRLRVRGIAVIDVEFTGRYILVPFTVVDIVDEVILGMDFLRQNDVTWDVAKGELHFQEGGTVYSQCAVTDPTLPTLPTCRAQLVRWTTVPANSQALVEVTFSSRGSMLPCPGMVSPVASAVAGFGVLACRAVVDPQRGDTCRIPVMNPTECAVELPAGTTVGVLQPVISLDTVRRGTHDGEPNPVSVGGANSEEFSDLESFGEIGSGGEIDSLLGNAASSLSNGLPFVDVEGDLSGLQAKAPKSRSLGSRTPPERSSLVREEGCGPEVPSPSMNGSTSQTGDGSSSCADTAHAQIPADGDGTVPEHLLKLYDATAELLAPNERELLRKVLVRNADIFAQHSTDLGSTDVATHAINTGDHQPIKQAPRRVPIHRQGIIQQEVETMLKKGIIEPCEGPWSSPIVLAKKKDGSLRFCIDFRKLNEATLKDAYPLPRIEDNLDTLGGSTWFSTLDLISGFWQVEMDAESKAKTAFSVGRGGLYQFRRMPFGLCNAPATFQRLMEKVLSGLQWEIAVLYIDDIVVFGNTVEQHLDRLESIFSRLRKAGLKLKPSKCSLLKRKVEFLGHVVSARGVEADPDKISKVKDWPQPRDVSEVRSFIGLCAYYRRFVRGFSDLCKPLYRLTEKGVTFHWGRDQEAAFIALKDKLTSAPILAFPNETDKFILDTDASAFGIGGVLSQVQDGEERVIAYGSRVLSKAERNYCVTRRELLAIVDFVKMFHHYLVGSKFLLRTDHAALYWLFGMKNLEGQPARWVERLGCYDMVIQHRPGVKHGNADALSRCPARCTQEIECSGPDGSEMFLSDFQAIRHFTMYDPLEDVEIDDLDSDWSDDEWEREDPLSDDEIADESYIRMVQAGDYGCVCRVQTRAQAREEGANPAQLDESEPDPPPAAPQSTPPRPRQSTTAARPLDSDGGEADNDQLADETGRAAHSGTLTDVGEVDVAPVAPAPVRPGPPRRPVGRPRLEKGPSTAEIVELQKQQEFLRTTPPFNWTDEEIAHMQEQDPDVAKLRRWVADKRVPSWHEVAKESFALKSWWARLQQMLLSRNNVLYIVWEHDRFACSPPKYRVVTPVKLRPYVLRELHDVKTAGHMGMRKTRERACRSRFYWPGMSTSVQRWVQRCLQCGSRKKPKHGKRQPMQTYRVGAKLDTVSIDILGPFKPRTTAGNVSILTITDHFTRWVEAYPLRDATASRIAQRVVDFVARFGMPLNLHSDQGSNVDGTVLGEVCRLLGISKTRTCPWHPQGNAITERENKVIVDMLSHFVDRRHLDWDEHLPVVMMAYRSSVHRVLGESPAALMFGHELRLPIDALVGPPPEAEHESVASSDYVQALSEALQVAHEAVRTRLESHYRYEKIQYDRHVQEQKFSVGQAIWLRNFPKTTTKSKKLMKPYSGPHIVIARVNAVTYKIKLSRGVDRVVHGDRLKPFYGAVVDSYLKSLWVPLAKGSMLAEETGAIRGVAVLFAGESV